MTPAGWDLTTWGEVVELRYGKALRDYRDAGGSVDVYGTNGPVGFTDVPQAKGPGVVVGRKGAYRGVHYAPRDFWVIDTAFYIAPRRPLDMRWAYYSLQLADINGLDSGSAIPSTTRESFAGLRAQVPPLAEQQAIAEVLGALDDKIAANTALATVVDNYLAALLNEMASGAEITTLRSIADVNRRSVKPKADGNLRYVDIASVAVGSFEYPEISAWSDAPGRARRGLSAGDTVWSTVRPNRRSHALNLEDDALLVASTGLAILSPREVGFAYLYEVSRRPDFTAYLENVAEGSAYPAVRAERFLEAPVPNLQADHIHMFEAQAAPLRELVASQARENRTLAATRDALLPQLMSGKLRVRDVEAAASEAGV